MSIIISAVGTTQHSAQRKERGEGGGGEMGLALGKVPRLQIPLRSKINFSGKHSPDPQGSFHLWDVSSTPKM